MSGHTGRMMVISFDAMGARDLEFMKGLPNFGRFWEGAAVCEHVNSVYPSITYPAHTSIVTGRMPKNHGIVNNTRRQPERPEPDWYWQRRFVKGTTLYDEVIKKGGRTAALLWPVTARSRIRWNIPEVLANRPWQTQVTASLTNSSPLYLLDMNRKFGKLRDGIRQPALDNFSHACVLDTIRRKNPQLFLVHYTDLDTQRHIYGVEHEKCTQAMRRHDERLGEILRALEETGPMEDTTVVVLGDHCQKNTKQVVFPNFFLKQEGYLSGKDGRVTDWQVMAKNCDGCCYLYLNPACLNPAVRQAGAGGSRNSGQTGGENGGRRNAGRKTGRLTGEAIAGRVRELFERLAADPANGIARILPAEEAAARGADPACLFMLEAAEGFYFLDDFEEPRHSVAEEKKHRMRATHGYLPEGEDYATFFAMKGCGVKAGASVASMTLWDEGPTLAKLLGVDLGETDGRVLEELLE